MKIKSISVITPVYNNYTDLEVSLLSLLKQKINNDIICSIFIIDDGSDNFDEEFVRSLVDKENIYNFSVNILINSSNIGTVRTLNKVLKLQNSELIIPLSSDDEFYDSNTIQKIIDFFNSTNYLIATSMRQPILNGLPLNPYPKTSHIPLFNDREKLLKYISKKGNIISGASTYYRREIFERIGYFDERYRLLEDYPFYLKVLSNQIDIGFINMITINYGLSGVSSGKGKRKRINPILRDDFKLAAEYIVNNYKFLSNNEKRIITYNRILSDSEKNLWQLKYFDLHILLLVKKTIRFIINYGKSKK